MKIPSPRKFVEIAAFTCFALFTCIGIIIAAFLLFVIWALECVYDGMRAWKSGRREFP